MHFTLMRYILISFLVAVAGFMLACLVALSSLEQIAVQLGTSDVAATLELIRINQFIVLLLSLGGFLGGLIGMAFAAHQAARIVDRLRQATRYLGDVVLDEIYSEDFLLASDGLDREIQEMMLKIKNSQQRYLDASPLTRLPGNMAIEQVLKDKMEQGEKFALCYIDLDDFKAFNDKYGYAKGSDLIKMTGEVLYRAKDEYADQQDFVGHIGGDDFVLITSPDKVESVCQAILDEFDSLIPEYYSPEDRSIGFIEGSDRYGVMRRFPIMSITIAVVSDEKRSFKSPIEIARVATEIKDYAKSLPGSNYLIDRRITTRWDT
ncbi:MAG: GGDEF domain-containing protein [Candidatus Marinimicrobia bacterium]|nr:GGDEF domain-containing protein [Candidatus Neomarinimicrobiota bacterium]